MQKGHGEGECAPPLTITYLRGGARVIIKGRVKNVEVPFWGWQCVIAPIKIITDYCSFFSIFYFFFFLASHIPDTCIYDVGHDVIMKSKQLTFADHGTLVNATRKKKEKEKKEEEGGKTTTHKKPTCESFTYFYLYAVYILWGLLQSKL